MVAGGDFVVSAGNSLFYYNIARWDGSSWSPLGGSIDGSVYALTTLPNGDLVAGGTFTTAGDVYAHNIARWDGSAWSPIGSGITGVVYALSALPNGDLLAAGSIYDAGGVQVNNIARWDGSAWSPLGTGISSDVREITTLPNGDIVVIGQFESAGGVPAKRIARWDGVTWSPLGSGVDSGMNGQPTSLEVVASLPNGELVAGGRFYTAGENVSINFARYSFTGIPTMSVHPLPQSGEPGDTITLAATPSNGYSNVSVQWHRNGVPLTDGPGGASTDGGIVSGAHSMLASPTRLSTATLTITNAQPSDAGDYTAIFSNACGGVTSDKAIVTIEPPCAADFNRDGGIDGADVAAFFDAWEAGDPSADVNHDGGIDGSDAQTFFNAWKTGGCE